MVLKSTTPCNDKKLCIYKKKAFPLKEGFIYDVIHTKFTLPV